VDGFAIAVRLALAFVVLAVVCAPAASGDPPAADRETILDLFHAGRYPEAEQRAREHLLAAERDSGPDSLETAAALDLLLEILEWRRETDRPEAVEMAERALRIRERRLSGDDPAVARSLQRLAMVRCAHAEFDAARVLLNRALDLRRSRLGPEHRDVAESLEGLAAVSLYLGEWESAESRLREALGIRERVQGAHDLDVGDTLMSLGVTVLMRGDIAAAETMFRRALEIRERGLPPSHPKIAGALHNLGAALVELGDLEGALAAYERLFAIHAASGGADDSRLAEAHVNAAEIAEELGDFSEARDHLERALELTSGIHGEDSPRFATILIQAAHLDLLMGDFGVARGRLERALEIRRSRFGPSHIDVAKTLTTLGSLELRTGNLESARRRFDGALAIYAEAQPEGSRLVAEAQAGLGMSLPVPAEADRARAALEEAVEAYEGLYGDDGRQLLWPLSGLAELRYRTGDLDAAAVAFQDLRERGERAYGPGHPYLLGVLEGEARVLAALGRPTEAMSVSLRAARLAERQVALTAAALAERPALAYAAHNRESLDVVLSVLISMPTAGDREVREAWDAVARARGAVLDEMTTRARFLANASDPEIREMTESLRSISARLANVQIRGPGERTERYDATIRDLRARRETIEQRLADLSREFRDDLEDARAGIDDAVARLPAGAALVAYARFDRRDPARPETEAVPSFVAFVQPADRGDATLIDLGPASDIEDLVAGWKKAVTAPPLPGAESSYRRTAGALRFRVWDPLASKLANATMVFVVPEGSLHLVSFASLPAEGDRYLVETGPLLHLLTTERDLARDDESGSQRTLLALGGPDFDVDRPAEPVAAAAVLPAYRSAPASCEDFRRMAFARLPSSIAEVEEIARLWSARGARREEGPETVSVLTGAAATESAFRRLAAHRDVVHLATHGFFLDERCAGRRDDPGITRGPGFGAPAAIAEADPQAALSGVVLAGANRRETAVPGDDGVLTAGEIAMLPLQDAKWVVLSACETGVGSVRTGEGVFGLRRAFRIAGARTLIMSLWEVEDRAARAWMRALYEARLEEGASTAEAVRRATIRTLQSRREAGRSTLPFYWAGFVAAGDWR